eukprot:TRINITY_DN3823_c0_g1_i4.p1 TRINITY_DN3823_c0_g1~~TRINITY_DN3823_c0_g1_i4.p1  ORF type:complete len:277 (-),score=45.44 TRINITY_DN3823_c0_g1_i4:216-1046(-)
MRGWWQPAFMAPSSQPTAAPSAVPSAPSSQRVPAPVPGRSAPQGAAVLPGSPRGRLPSSVALGRRPSMSSAVVTPASPSQRSRVYSTSAAAYPQQAQQAPMAPTARVVATSSSSSVRAAPLASTSSSVANGSSPMHASVPTSTASVGSSVMASKTSEPKQRWRFFPQASADPEELTARQAEQLGSTVEALKLRFRISVAASLELKRMLGVGAGADDPEEDADEVRPKASAASLHRSAGGGVAGGAACVGGGQTPRCRTPQFPAPVPCGAGVYGVLG